MSITASSRLALAIAMASAFATTHVQAESAPVEASPRFDVTGYHIAGNTLLPEGEIETLLKPYTGKQRDFGDVQRALEALQDAYGKLGYGSVQVILPEQELKDGVVDLKVVEQRIISVKVEGNQFHETENILASVPSLKAGELPNTKAIGSSLKVANENPSKKTAVLFNSSEAEEDAVDATVKVIDEKPWKAFLTLDNSGSRETGHGRVGVGYQHYNAFGKDHRLTAQYITTPHMPDNLFNPTHDVNVFGFGYSIPLYGRGDSIDLLAAYSDVSAVSALQVGTIPIKGLILGGRYNHNLDKVGNYEHKVSAALDYRATRKIGFTQAVSSTPLSLNYAGQWTQDDRVVSFDLGWVKNIPSLVAHGDSSDFANSYAGEDDFNRYTWRADYYGPIAKTWQLHLAANGQLTGDHMIPSEAFRVGGMDSVRGWHESVFSGDKGYRWSAELISPDFGKPIGDNVGVRAVIFTDKGHVSDNKTVFHTQIGRPEISIGSIGAGLRFNYKRDFAGRLDYAYVIDADDSPATRALKMSTRQKGDTFMHVSMGWIW